MLPTEHYAYPGLQGGRFLLSEVEISLVSPRQPGTPVSKFLASKGEGVNHISLQVTSLEESMSDWQVKGVEFTSPGPLPFPDGRVAFVHPKSLHGVQVALVELNSVDTP